MPPHVLEHPYIPRALHMQYASRARLAMGVEKKKRPACPRDHSRCAQDQPRHVRAPPRRGRAIREEELVTGRLRAAHGLSDRRHGPVPKARDITARPKSGRGGCLHLPVPRTFAQGAPRTRRPLRTCRRGGGALCPVASRDDMSIELLCRRCPATSGARFGSE